MNWSAVQLSVVMFFVVERSLDAVAYGDGAPLSSCGELRPIHNRHEPQQTPNPYQIQFVDGVVDYCCGDTVRSKFLCSLYMGSYELRQKAQLSQRDRAILKP